MSGKKSPYPDGRIPDRNPDGTPAVPWKVPLDRGRSSLSGWWLQPEEWPFCSLWVCSSTAPTPVLVLPDWNHSSICPLSLTRGLFVEATQSRCGSFIRIVHKSEAAV